MRNVYRNRFGFAKQILPVDKSIARLFFDLPEDFLERSFFLSDTDLRGLSARICIGAGYDK
jgi:hypothetical protein